MEEKRRGSGGRPFVDVLTTGGYWHIINWTDSHRVMAVHGFIIEGSHRIPRLKTVSSRINLKRFIRMCLKHIYFLISSIRIYQLCRLLVDDRPIFNLLYCLKFQRDHIMRESLPGFPKTSKFLIFETIKFNILKSNHLLFVWNMRATDFLIKVKLKTKNPQ